MDTVVTIQVPDGAVTDLPERFERAFGWFREVERRCSRFDPQSELRRLAGRTGSPVKVSPLLYRAIEFALAVATASDGAFDPTVGAVMERRGFNRNYRTGEIIASPACPEPASYHDVMLNSTSRTVTFLRPLQLDLGAVAKGLAVDLAAAELSGVESFLINAGGDILVRGLSPKGELWRVGVKDPLDPTRLLTVLTIGDGAVCTSGGYERQAGAGQHHIIAPASGVSPTDVASVTVVAQSAMVADALSTAAFVLGCEAGRAFASKQGVDALLVDQTGRLFTTEGFEGLLPCR
jgi:thiamine biosynthesis lipoprotein